MTIQWRFACLPVTETDIVQAEIKLGFRLPPDIRGRILVINGGYPDPACFQTVSGAIHVLNNLLSIRQSDDAYMPDYVLEGSSYEQQLVPFASDGFGNLICFNRQDQNALYYWSHESDRIDRICASFTELESKLFADH